MLRNIKNWLDKHQKKIKLLLYIYFCILTWLLLRPSQNNDSFKLLSLFYNDKLVHTITFLGLSFLGMFSYPKKNPLIIIFIFTFYGILIEFLQEYMNLGRTFEYGDMLADFIGSIAGVIIAKKIMIKR